MAKSYNERLKEIRYKGLCGDPEVVDIHDILNSKVDKLCTLINASNYIVLFTGAGISTSSGIADFRGPNGVWTKELKGEKNLCIDSNLNSFDKARPSFTHYAAASLLHAGIFKHIISQNVDGLHLRSGVPEEKLSELHGNIFKEKCENCNKEYFRDFDVGGMGLKLTGRKCDDNQCNGLLRDFAIDWDTDLPVDIFRRAHKEHDKADLIICLGTSLRIRPAGNMPLRVLTPKKSRGGRKGELVIVNLQQTHLDKKATVKINGYCDEVMKSICDSLGVTLANPDGLHSSLEIGNKYSIKDNSLAADYIIQQMSHHEIYPKQLQSSNKRKRIT